MSVALLADVIHNLGDALTAIPLGLAFFFRSAKGERLAGLAVVLAIFISALVALGQTIERFIHPRNLSHLWLLAAAGIIGFVGNEIAAQVRLRAGRRTDPRIPPSHSMNRHFETPHGKTGKVTGPHLHFEVRENGTARDPMQYLTAPT